MQEQQDDNVVRVLSLIVICLVTIANIVAFFFFGNGGQSFLPNKIVFSELMQALISFISLYVLAPVFIGLRVIYAPRGSSVYTITLITCAVGSFFLYAFFACGATGQCNLYKFINIPIFWAGAFFCLIPKWK